MTNIAGSGFITRPLYHYLWRRTYWENVLDEIDARIRAVDRPTVHRI